MPCTLIDRIRIERGVMADYQGLSRFHYRSAHPGAVKRIWRAVLCGRSLASRLRASRMNQPVPADDVEVVANGKTAKQLDVAIGEFRQLARRQARSVSGDRRQQLRGEQLRKQQEVGLVVGGHVDEELALSREVIEAADPPHLVLHR